VTESDVGATIGGITAEKAKPFLLELVWAAARGDLAAPKVPIAVRAAALDPAASASTLADVIWLVSLELEALPDMRANLVVGLECTV
jgi:hypothetical protein